MSPPRRLRFATRVLLLQLAVVVAAVALTAGIFAALTAQRLGEDAEARALAVARTVAASTEVRRTTAELAALPPATLDREALATGPLQRDAEAIRERSGALFVVITDETGNRLSHPNPLLLGELVSTDPSEALAGREETSQETGTLGRSARAKVPVYAPAAGTGTETGTEASSGTGTATSVVGEVSVGFSSDAVAASLLPSLGPLALVTAASLGAATLASLLLGSRLRRLTLGLEPEDIAGLVQDQEAVLRGVDEGVIGVSAAGTITVCNAEARRLLAPGAASVIDGLTVADADLPAFVTLAATGTAEYGPVEHVLGDRVVIVTARPVTLAATAGRERGGTPALGRVIMVRDRTEVLALTRQLDAVTALGTALRAQRHEFANRLHTVAGLLDIEQPAEARGYLGTLMNTGPLHYPAPDLALLGDPYLEAFIGAKSIEAHERGVALRLGPNTAIRGRLTDPQDVTAILGNLLDNALRAAVLGSAPDRWVEVELLDEATATTGVLHLVVADSGDGLPPATTATQASAEDAAAAATTAGDVREVIFTPGYSTATTVTGDPDPAAGHGVGLALVRHLARRRGGEVWVADAGSPTSHGAVFCARLPGVVSFSHSPEDLP